MSECDVEELTNEELLDLYDLVKKEFENRNIEQSLPEVKLE